MSSKKAQSCWFSSSPSLDLPNFLFQFLSRALGLGFQELYKRKGERVVDGEAGAFEWGLKRIISRQLVLESYYSQCDTRIPPWNLCALPFSQLKPTIPLILIWVPSTNSNTTNPLSWSLSVLPKKQLKENLKPSILPQIFN